MLYKVLSNPFLLYKKSLQICSSPSVETANIEAPVTVGVAHQYPFLIKEKKQEKRKKH